eukprot:7465925-Pyramimonas_sp.AAC.2
MLRSELRRNLLSDILDGMRRGLFRQPAKVVLMAAQVHLGLGQLDRCLRLALGVLQVRNT